jgi:hypothetical protein
MAKKEEPPVDPVIERQELDAERRTEAFEEAQADKSRDEKKADKESEKAVADMAVKKGDRLYGGLVVHEIHGMHVTVRVPQGFVLRTSEVIPIQQVRAMAAPPAVDPHTGEELDEGLDQGGRVPLPGNEPAEFGTLSMAQAEALKIRQREQEAGIPAAKQLATTGTSGGSGRS